MIDIATLGFDVGVLAVKVVVVDVVVAEKTVAVVAVLLYCVADVVAAAAAAGVGDPCNHKRSGPLLTEQQTREFARPTLFFFF